MAGEVGHVGALLQIPDLDLGVRRAGSKDETVGMELGAGQGWRREGNKREQLKTDPELLRSESHAGSPSLTNTRTLVRDLGEDSAGLDVGEGPVLQEEDERE